MRSRTVLFALCQAAWQIRPAAASPYQNRVLETGTVFPAPAEYGTWQMAWNAADSPEIYAADLVYIQTNNAAGTGNVQVQIASFYESYGYVVTDQSTTFPLENNGVWQLADYNNDGLLDLIYIQNRNTASGKVEVKVASGLSNFETLILQTQTAFDPQINGRWQMADVDGDGSLDLAFIQNSGTASNKVEVLVASGASKFATVTTQVATTFNIANDGTWQLADYDNDGTLDLVYIQNMNTESGYVEVTIASGASNWQTIVQSVPTTFEVENNGVWQMIDWVHGGSLDLVYMKLQDTTGSVEVHVASGQDQMYLD